MSPTSIEAVVQVELCSSEKSEAVFKALLVEAENPPDPERGDIRVERKDGRVVARIHARDYSSARALLNAVLTLVASLTDTLDNIKSDCENNTPGAMKSHGWLRREEQRPVD